MSTLPLPGISRLIDLPGGKKTRIPSLIFEDEDEQVKELMKSVEEDVVRILLKGCPESMTLKATLTNDPNIRNLVDVNAVNSGRFNYLNILDVPPCSGKIGTKINSILGGARALRARDFANYDASKRTVNGCKATIKYTSIFGTQIAYCVMLVIFTMLAVITYLAPFSAPAIHYRYKTNNFGNLQPRKSDSIITPRSFIMFNSMGFIASVAMIIFLLHEFPLKPWPQISISAMFGSYMCLIMAISPDEALPLLLLSTPFLLLAAAGKMYGFAGRGLI